LAAGQTVLLGFCALGLTLLGFCALGLTLLAKRSPEEWAAHRTTGETAGLAAFERSQDEAARCGLY